jgi:hypothetical protein
MTNLALKKYLNHHKNSDIISFVDGIKVLDSLKEELYSTYFKNAIHSAIKESDTVVRIGIFNESVEKLKNKIFTFDIKELTFGEIKQLLEDICKKQNNIQKTAQKIKDSKNYRYELSRIYKSVGEISESVLKKILKERQAKKQRIAKFEDKVEKNILSKLQNVSLEKVVSITLKVLMEENTYQICNTRKKQNNELSVNDFLIILLQDFLEWSHKDIVKFLGSMQIKMKNTTVRQKLKRAWDKLEVLVIDRINKKH